MIVNSTGATNNLHLPRREKCTQRAQCALTGTDRFLCGGLRRSALARHDPPAEYHCTPRHAEFTLFRIRNFLRILSLGFPCFFRQINGRLWFSLWVAKAASSVMILFTISFNGCEAFSVARRSTRIDTQCLRTASQRQHLGRRHKSK